MAPVLDDAVLLLILSFLSLEGAPLELEFVRVDLDCAVTAEVEVVVDEEILEVFLVD